jgi:hypothetical protein
VRAISASAIPSRVASLDTTRRSLDATAEGLREVVRGHPGQLALREHLRESKS